MATQEGPPLVLGKRKRGGPATKRTTRRRRSGRKARITRAIVPKVYTFKRTQSYLADAGSPPAGWFITTESPAALVATIAFDIADLPSYSEFANLFQLYRLTKVESTFIPGWNPNIGDPASGIGVNLLVRWKSNRTGQGLGSGDTDAAWNQCQDVKRSTFAGNVARPLKITQKLNQLGETYASTVNTDYAVREPGWISTTESGTAHYGYDVRFDMCQDILAINPGGSYRDFQMRVDHVITIECKGVQ